MILGQLTHPGVSFVSVHGLTPVTVHMSFSLPLGNFERRDTRVQHRVKACSHEPGVVNYPGVMVAPEQALPRVHMMICCPGATLSKVNFNALGQVHRHLLTTNLSEIFQFLHKLLQRMNFKHFYLFLVLSGTF